MSRGGEKTGNAWLIKAILFLILAVLVLFGYALSKELYKKKQVQEEIDSLRAEAERIEKENMRLEERISYLGSKDYQEREAKEKLNLQNPGEKLVIITPSPSKKIEEKKEELPASFTPPEKIPNYKKWWKYFFK